MPILDVSKLVHYSSLYIYDKNMNATIDSYTRQYTTRDILIARA